MKKLHNTGTESKPYGAPRRTRTLGPVALLAAGRNSISIPQSLANLHYRLGPVASTSLRLASRFSNLLQAGYAVEDWAAVDSSDVVLIAAPDPAAIAGKLIRIIPDWSEKAVVVCDAFRGSEALDELKKAGAAVGSVAPVEGFESKLYVVEGDRAAVREVKQLVEEPGVRVVCIDRAQKALYSAGLSFATALALPLITASVETIRAAGLDQRDALAVAQKQFQLTLRTYAKAGRKGWQGQIARQDDAGVRRQVQALFKLSPMLASYFFENAVMCTQLFKQDATWLKTIASQVMAKSAAAGD